MKCKENSCPLKFNENLAYPFPQTSSSIFLICVHYWRCTLINKKEKSDVNIVKNQQAVADYKLSYTKYDDRIRARKIKGVFGFWKIERKEKKIEK